MKQHMRTSLGIFAVLILSGVAAAQSSHQKHLKRSVCLAQCAAEIAATCVPHHHFHQCRGRLIRACQHRKPGVCVTTTTTTTPSTTTTTPPSAGGSTTTTTLATSMGCTFKNGKCTGSCAPGSTCGVAVGTASCECRSTSCGNAKTPQCNGACASASDACVFDPLSNSCHCVGIP
jgi:hypothetical protein